MLVCRNRPAFMMTSWDPQPQSLGHHTKDNSQHLTAQQIQNNTTRGLTPGIINPQLPDGPENRVPLPERVMNAGKPAGPRKPGEPTQQGRRGSNATASQHRAGKKKTLGNPNESNDGFPDKREAEEVQSSKSSSREVKRRARYPEETESAEFELPADPRTSRRQHHPEEPHGLTALRKERDIRPQPPRYQSHQPGLSQPRSSPSTIPHQSLLIRQGSHRADTLFNTRYGAELSPAQHPSSTHNWSTNLHPSYYGHPQRPLPLTYGDIGEYERRHLPQEPAYNVQNPSYDIVQPAGDRGTYSVQTPTLNTADYSSHLNRPYPRRPLTSRPAPSTIAGPPSQLFRQRVLPAPSQPPEPSHEHDTHPSHPSLPHESPLSHWYPNMFASPDNDPTAPSYPDEPPPPNWPSITSSQPPQSAPTPQYSLPESLEYPQDYGYGSFGTTRQSGFDAYGFQPYQHESNVPDPYSVHSSRAVPTAEEVEAARLREDAVGWGEAYREKRRRR
ncbi:MAG: hypothetical protein Q9200_001256 [Gallowayella weberi]